MIPEVFALDANFVIEAYRRTYSMDVFPIFWDKISELAHRGVLCSIDIVRDELCRVKDDLSSWCYRELPEDFLNPNMKAQLFLLIKM